MGDDAARGPSAPGPIEEALARAAMLPGPALAALFARYGKPLDEPLPPAGADEPRLDVAAAEGVVATVRVVNVRTMVDVIGNDWFVLDAVGAAPLAMPGPLFASAVAALTRKARGDDG